MANFSDLALDFASMMAGLRKNLVEELKTFNPSLQGIMDDWKTMKPQPVIRCLCETDLTKTPGGYKQIVSSVSAGFMDTTAETVAGTNHNTVCRFETKFDRGWPKVLDSIQELRRELLEQTIEMSREPENIYMPGRPPISAPSFPALENLFYFNEIDRQPSKQFVGRAELLEDIETQLNESQSISKTALTGIAGAGVLDV
ncbi:hypothetical protein NW762_014169 [Fusarium torreyae]|uniref:Uncharacterized protein n=1 Tax=Fusarium torreyae TaxID=1237075 RepID=A0A9W8RKZ9_9HYPO|nr:hypothetical protein NW762_014169 [Fusarium torreyae]